jgi:nicotinate-nucleotide adenylyltransferase
MTDELSQPDRRRVGLLGGTFDPVHLGHLLMAEQCREQARLDQVWFVPSARPPHKEDREKTQFAQRVEMLALAIAGHPNMQVCTLEGERPGLSYTVNTLEELRRQHPQVDFGLILGADSVVDLPLWREPARIVEMAFLLVVARPGFTLLSAEQLGAALHLPADKTPRVQVVSMPLIEISSRDLRRRVAEGKSIRYQVSRGVECYIENHGLYRPPT